MDRWRGGKPLSEEERNRLSQNPAKYPRLWLRFLIERGGPGDIELFTKTAMPFGRRPSRKIRERAIRSAAQESAKQSNDVLEKERMENLASQMLEHEKAQQMPLGKRLQRLLRREKK